MDRGPSWKMRSTGRFGASEDASKELGLRPLCTDLIARRLLLQHGYSGVTVPSDN